MAEMKEVRHAGIGIQLNIGGLEEFRRLNDEIDKLMSKFQEFKSKVKGVDDGFNGLKNSKNNIIQISDYMKDMNKNLDKTKAPLKDINKGFNDISNASKDAKKDADLSAPIKKGKSAIDESKKSFLNLNGLIDKLPINKFKDLKEHISASKKATDESSKAVEKEKGLLDKMQERSTKFHDALRDSFFGSAISNGFSWVTGEIKSITKEGYELAAGGEQIRAQWKNIGLSDSNAHGMTDEIADIRGKSDMAGSSIDAMQKKFYALTGSVPKAKQLTDEISAFGSAAGKSGEQIQSIGMGVAKLTGSKTVSSGLFQRTFGQLPALQKAVVSASGMTQKAFTGALQGGKITGDQLQGYLSKAAKNSGKEWSAFGKTTRGQIAGLQGTFQNLKATFAAPMVSGISDALKDVSKQKGGLGDVKKQLTEIAKAIGTKVGNAIGDAIQFLVKNRKALAELGGALFTIVKNIGLGVWKAFAGTLEMISGHSKDASGGLKSVADFASGVAKHQSALQTFGKGLAGILVTIKLLQGYNTGKNFLGLGKDAGLIFKPKVNGEEGEKELTFFAKKIKKAGSGIASSLKWTAKIGQKAAKGAIKELSSLVKGSGLLIKKGLKYTAEVATKSAKKAVQGLGRLTKSSGRAISKGLKLTAKVATKGAIVALNLLKKAAIGAGKGFKTMGNFMKANPFIAIIAAVVAVIAIFVALYKHNKKFRNFVNGLIKWAKNFAKGIAKWFGQAYKDATKWITKMVKDVKKRWGTLWTDSISIFKNAWKVIKDVMRIFKDIFTGDFTDLKKVIPKLVNDLWKLVKSCFKGAYDWLDDLTGGWITRLVRGFKGAWDLIGKGWHDFWNGIDSWFKNLWKGIVGHVQDGMNDVINVMNGGIKGINWVISKFGGSSSTIGTIAHVKLATGTGVFSNQRRAITRPTMAMLNDGHDSPQTGNQETLIHANGAAELIQGTNVMRMLEPGAEVLNATETRSLGLNAFAGGTGFFSNLWQGAKSVGSSIAGGIKSGFGAVAGVLQATKKTFDLAKNIVKSPATYLEKSFTKPTGKGQIMAEMAKGTYDSIKKQAGDWWNGLWSMVDLDGDGAGSGSRGAFLSKAIELGKSAKGYSEGPGRLGPDYYDCSGLVYTTLKKMGITLGGSTTIPEYNSTSPISWDKAEPGDLAFYGAGGSQHVGIVSSLAGAGKMWNAENPNDGIKYGPIKGFGDFVGLRRIRQLSSKDSSSNDKDKGSKKGANGGLQKLIKKQVGGKFFSFMRKLADKFGDNGSLGNVSLSGDVASRARSLAKAIKSLYSAATNNGIAAVLGNWSFESGLNPGAINSGGGASGLGQWLGGRKSNLIAYASKHGQNWKNAGAQLSFAVNGEGSDSSLLKSVLSGSGSVSSLATRFSEGWERGGYTAQHVAGAQKVASALKGYATGGDVPGNQLSVVGEKGWELFKPRSGGHVFDHETSKKILSGGRGGNQKIEVHGATVQMTVNGNADSNTVSKLQSVMNDSNDALVDKLRQVLGLNDKGGLIV